MKKIVLFSVFLMISQLLSAQLSTTDSIIVEKNKIMYQGTVLTNAQLKDILKVSPMAYQEYQSSRGSFGIASVLSYAGGFLIGWPLGTAVGGGEPQWAMAGIGAGLVALAIPIANASKNKTIKAINIYNSDLQQPVSRNSAYDLKMGFTANGMGLRLRF